MKLHRMAYLVTLPLLIVLATLGTVHGDGNLHPSEYCTNEKCSIAADEILRVQNRSINPCNNFHAHACSGQKGTYFFYTNIKIHEEISELFKNMQPGELEALKKAKKFQDACTNKDAIKRRGLTPIERILSDNGEWPVTIPSDKWNSQIRSWQEIHEHFVKRTGISALFDVTVEIDRGNTGLHILSLGVPTVPSERGYLNDLPKSERRNSDYRQYLTKVVKKMKTLREFDVKDDNLLADVERIIRFEDELVKLAIDLDKDDNENGDDLLITTIEKLQNDWDAAVPRISNYSINWFNVINDRFKGTEIVIDASEKIALKPAAFVANFTRVLMDTPVRTIVNYIHGNVIDNLLPEVYTKGIWNRHAKQRALVTSDSGKCIVAHKMIHAVAYMYVKKHLSVRSKTAALEMVQNIKDEIKGEIRESSGLDEATKSVAEMKIDNMTNIVGYPEWYDKPGKIDDYYREFTVGPDHFENVIAYNKFEAKKQLSKLRSLVDETETEWFALPYIANAEYRDQSNAFNIPAAILQSPFFVYERPSVLNYGSLGAIVGQAIAFGFAHLGRLYHYDGIERKWWSQSAIDTFKTKKQCFDRQYEKYTVDIKNKNDNLNYMEPQMQIIAGTMGFRAGLRAYQRLKNDGKTNNGKIQLLDNFTDEQLYFYELANTYCEPFPRDSIAVQLAVIATISNMQEFADAFHCPLGSRMNPLEKCLIWD